MVRKSTERNRVLGYFVKADLVEAKALAEDVRLILRNRQPKVGKKGKKTEAERIAEAIPDVLRKAGA